MAGRGSRSATCCAGASSSCRRARTWRAALGLPVLAAQDLRIDETVAARSRDVLIASTPLWYYVLAEAEQEPGMHLGPVGGTIVAEVLAGLLHADPGAYVHDPAWRPRADGAAFGMADLIRLARGAEGG